MRLIDADKLKAELFDADWMMDNDEHMVEEIVERQPTVDDETVRHGRWELCYEDWRKQIAGDMCSACGFRHYGCGISHYHYCPNCGAKMEGGVEK